MSIEHIEGFFVGVVFTLAVVTIVILIVVV